MHNQLKYIKSKIIFLRWRTKKIKVVERKNKKIKQGIVE